MRKSNMKPKGLKIGDHLNRKRSTEMDWFRYSELTWIVYKAVSSKPTRKDGSEAALTNVEVYKMRTKAAIDTITVLMVIRHKIFVLKNRLYAKLKSLRKAKAKGHK